VKAVREQRDQIAEHMPGRRKPMEQQQYRSVCPAGFAIRNLEAANIGSAVMNGIHENTPG
jgi:hypothetical protein